MNYIQIGNCRIGSNFDPFVIAELSGNHNQSLERALAIVDAAAEAGVHALKLQTYTPDTMTLDLKFDDFVITDNQMLWKGVSLYELYKQAYTPWEWHRPIMERCLKKGITCFSTPFDATAVDFLEELCVPCYKIASFENTDIPLLRKVGATKKPVIMSTGMASLAELDESVKTLRDAGCNEIILLKCTSSYPATPEGSNLLTIPHLKAMFNTEIGISDHTLGVGVSIAAVTLGASVIEKHFTLNRSEGGVDSQFSIEPHEMRVLVEESKNARLSLGEISYGTIAQEEKTKKFRRSLYIVSDIKKGEVLTPQNLRSIRPGAGLAPKFYEILLGKKVSKDLKKGTPITWDIFE